MSDWHVRLAHKADAEFYPAIERAAAGLFADDPDCAAFDFSDVRTPEQHRRLIAKGHCLTAVRDGTIIGFLVTEPLAHELHIWEMDVHPDFQGRGIGAVLLRACLIDAKNSGFQAATLTTFRDLPWNGPFYERIGFVQVEDLEGHPRLSQELDAEAAAGLPRGRRIAMIRFLGGD